MILKTEYILDDRIDFIGDLKCTRVLLGLDYLTLRQNPTFQANTAPELVFILGAMSHKNETEENLFNIQRLWSRALSLFGFLLH